VGPALLGRMTEYINQAVQLGPGRGGPKGKNKGQTRHLAPGAAQIKLVGPPIELGDDLIADQQHRRPGVVCRYIPRYGSRNRHGLSA